MCCVQAEAVRLFELRSALSCRVAPVEPVGEEEVARIVAAFEAEGRAEALTPAQRDACARAEREVCGPAVRAEAARAADEEAAALTAAKRAVRAPEFAQWVERGHGKRVGDDPPPAVAAEAVAWRDRRPVYPVPGVSEDAAGVVRAGSEWQGVDEEAIAEVRAQA